MSTLPKGWTEVALGDVCEFWYGKSLPAKQRTGSGTPVYGSNGVVGHHEHSMTAGDTIVVGRKGSFGEVSWSGGPCWPIDTTYYIDGTATSANLRWLFWVLPSLGLKDMNRAAAVPGLNREDAYRQRLLLPPLDEQRRIAAILDKADELRAKRRAALEQLDSLTQAIFLDMFPPGSGTRTSLGEFGGDAFEVFTDGDWVESKDQDPSGRVRLTQLADVGDGVFLNKSSRFMTEEKAKALRCTFLEPGDVLVARMPDPLGRAAVFPGSEQPCVTVVDICVMRVDRSFAVPEWLASAINSPALRNRIARFATGSTRKRISRSNLGRVEIDIPPLAQQEAFAAHCLRLRETGLQVSAECEALDELFASLQSRAFRGEL